MNRQTFTHYGFIIAVVIILAIMVAFATPFGDYITGSTGQMVGTFSDKSNSGLSEANSRSFKFRPLLTQRVLAAQSQSGDPLEYEAPDLYSPTLKDGLIAFTSGSVPTPNAENAVIIDVTVDGSFTSATLTFDVCDLAQEGDEIAVYHYNEGASTWEYICTSTTSPDRQIEATFASLSPVALVNISRDYTANEEPGNTPEEPQEPQEPAEITDLTGTTWEFGSTVTVNTADVGNYSINYYIECDNEEFNSNNGTFFNIVCTQECFPPHDCDRIICYITINTDSYQYFSGCFYPNGGRIFEGVYGTSLPETINNTATFSPTYVKRITITGGTDATNADLIAWLQANASFVGFEQPGTQSTLFEQYNQFVMLSNYDMGVLINEDGSISLTYYGEVVQTMPSDFITFSGNQMTISGSETEYDGNYEIFNDGYLEFEGYPMAKSTATWVEESLLEDVYGVVVMHNSVPYYSWDGNSLDAPMQEDYEEELNAYYEIATSDNPETASLIFCEATFPNDVYLEYSLEDANSIIHLYTVDYENNTLNLRQFYDLYALKHSVDGGHTVHWGTHLCKYYEYWGGFAFDSLDENEFITYVTWHANPTSEQTKRVDGKITTKVSRLDGGYKTYLPLDYTFVDGVYFIETEEIYYHDGVETTNVFFVEDEPYYFEEGMTFRDWISSEYAYSEASASDLWAYTWWVVFVTRDYLDEDICSTCFYPFTTRSYFQMRGYPDLEFAYSPDSDYWYGSDGPMPYDTIFFRYTGALDPGVEVAGIKITYRDNYNREQILDVATDGLSVNAYDIWCAIDDMDYEFKPRLNNDPNYSRYEFDVEPVFRQAD